VPTQIEEALLSGGKRKRSATPLVGVDRWKYTDFGLAFAEKYKHLRKLASRSAWFSGMPRGWWLDQSIAKSMRLGSEQWARLRSAKPPGKAHIHTHHLMSLVIRFRLNEVLGDDAWRLFLPDVTPEAFERALERVGYGSIPSDQSGPFAIPQLDRYALKCPATLEEYDETVRITRQTFFDDVIDLEADREAFKQNPYTMVVLVDLLSERGNVLGWVDIYHLPDEDFERMIHTGEVVIDPSRLADFPASCHATRGYTASIVISPGREYLARLLVYGMMDFLLKFQFFSTDSFELFAVGGTKKGDQLLQDRHFNLVCEVQMEAGLQNLYSLKLRKQELERELESFGQQFGVARARVRLEIENPYTVTQQ
jgi:hypothetical protein